MWGKQRTGFGRGCRFGGVAGGEAGSEKKSSEEAEAERETERSEEGLTRGEEKFVVAKQ